LKVWVDLVNSPQVLVLRPIIAELRRRGHAVVITSRDFAQTTQLADQVGLTHVSFGRHGGSSRMRALAYNLERVGALARFAFGSGFDLAVSHNSYSQVLAARLLGIPVVTMMDYEHHRANHLAFRLARRVLVPRVFPNDAVRVFGACNKTVRYPGLKEELYLSAFRPDPGFRARLGVPDDQVIVVLRPPATWADYYDGRGQTFAAMIDVLRGSTSFVVYLPRVRSQAGLLRALPPERVLEPDRALDGPNLLAAADVVISGGGTMIREAAVLGTPAYSIFEGKLGAVDACLGSEGRLRWIRSAADVNSIRLEPKPASVARPAWPGLVGFVTDAILGAPRQELAG
jgi:predicted glycosyltransferase